MEFRPWPPIARLNRGMVITEKLDGTNAAIGITDDEVYAQSRTRIITPGKGTDNFGFAQWVAENADQLRLQLGNGLHFGEWYGSGIQRGYGLTTRRFALFNVKRFGYLNDPEFIDQHPEALCEAVPVIYEGPFDQARINGWVDYLAGNGSFAVPGFMKPEGIVVFHVAAGTLFKVTIENDEAPKSTIQRGQA